MSKIIEQQILDALGSVIEPGLGKDIVTLGMVSGVIVKDGNVGFAIEVDPSKGAEMEPLRKAAEAKVHELPGVVSVTAVLTAERTASATPGRGAQGPGTQGPGAPGPGAQGAGAPAGRGPQQSADARPLVPGVGSIVAVASGKGGVGKSTTAANLALALATLGLKIGVLDADVYGPSQPRMLGISGRPSAPDGKTLKPLENYNIKCMSMGFLIAEDTPMIWRGPMVSSALQQMLREVEHSKGPWG